MEWPGYVTSDFRADAEDPQMPGCHQILVDRCSRVGTFSSDLRVICGNLAVDTGYSHIQVELIGPVMELVPCHRVVRAYSSDRVEEFRRACVGIAPTSLVSSTGSSIFKKKYKCLPVVSSSF